MVLLYIIPFTLLVLLGPLLQAKSHYRGLNWINKLKPFLDAFYGPYTSRYRYWPGILLLARVTILLTYAFYSHGDSPFKLMAVSVIVAILLSCWMLIGKTENISLHQKKLLNYLELFFLLNLQSPHFTTPTSLGTLQTSRDWLWVSVLFASCGILVYQVFRILRRFNEFLLLIPVARCMADKDNTSKPTSPQKPADISTKTTYSVVEMKEGAMPTNDLKEPLLTNS